jgi:hypothetical protein
MRRFSHLRRLAVVCGVACLIASLIVMPTEVFSYTAGPRCGNSFDCNVDCHQSSGTASCGGGCNRVPGDPCAACVCKNVTPNAAETLCRCEPR